MGQLLASKDMASPRHMASPEAGCFSQFQFPSIGDHSVRAGVLGGHPAVGHRFGPDEWLGKIDLPLRVFLAVCACTSPITSCNLLQIETSMPLEKSDQPEIVSFLVTMGKNP